MNLREARTELHPPLSQAALANLAGVKRSVIADIEAGRSAFTLENQQKIWKALLQAKRLRQPFTANDEDQLSKVKTEIAFRLWKQAQLIIELQAKVIKIQQQIIQQYKFESSELVGLKQRQAELMDLLNVKHGGSRPS